MKRILFNLKYVFLIMSLLLIFSQTVFAEGINGDINDDDAIDLADVIMTLQVISGLNPGGISVDADIDSDGRIGMAEAIYALRWAAGMHEYWEAILYDDDGRAGGWINFTLTKHEDDSVTADGNYSYEIDTTFKWLLFQIPLNETVSGGFHDQDMTIEGNKMSTVYEDQTVISITDPISANIPITYYVSIYCETNNGTVEDGTWSVITDPPLIVLGGPLQGTRILGYGITE
jgi:hypothetical protein